MKTIEEILAAQRALVAAAETESRAMTDDEVTQFEALEAEGKAITRTNEIRARQAAYETPANHVGVHVATPKADDTLERAFDAYLRSGEKNADIAELRAQGEGVPSEGGYLVPDSMQAKIITRMKAYGGIQSAAENITTADGRTMTWVTSDDVANVGEIVEENGTFTSGADVVFGSASLPVFNYAVGGAGGAPLRLSENLIEDSSVDIQSYVAGLLGDRLSRLIAVHLATGNGAGQPKGLVHGLTGVEIAADGSGITYDDLVNWTHAVDPAYRAGSVWVLPDAVVARIKLIKDSHGDPVFRSATADLATGTGGDTILGHRVVVDQALPDIDVDNNTLNFGAFGNVRLGYVVRTVQNGISIKVNPFTRMSYNQIEISAWARAGATQQNTHAYVALTGEA